MTDIVERLRKGAAHGVLIPCEDLTEAADEIERLRDQAWKYLQECGEQARRADGVAQAALGPCTQAEIDAFEGLDSKSKQLFSMWVERALAAEEALALSSTHQLAEAKQCSHPDAKVWFYRDDDVYMRCPDCRSRWCVVSSTNGNTP